MKKLSDYKGEDALDLIADLIEPCVEIFGDKEIQSELENGQFTVKVVKKIFKKHKKELIEILAVLNEVEPSEFNYGAFEIINMAMQMLEDEELIDFFDSQSQTSATSGSITEITTEIEQG